jgi:hypothetical protein
MKCISRAVISWRWMGTKPGSLYPLKIDQICCYKRRQFEDFELTFRPEITYHIVYVMAPGDKVLWYPSTVVY